LRRSRSCRLRPGGSGAGRRCITGRTGRRLRSWLSLVSPSSLRSVDRADNGLYGRRTRPKAGSRPLLCERQNFVGSIRGHDDRGRGRDQPDGHRLSAFDGDCLSLHLRRPDSQGGCLRVDDRCRRGAGNQYCRPVHTWSVIALKREAVGSAYIMVVVTAIGTSGPAVISGQDSLGLQRFFTSPIVVGVGDKVALGTVCIWAGATSVTTAPCTIAGTAVHNATAKKRKENIIIG
jgi:hypothetical protein